ncbi:cytochrome b5 domain-containing protein [candidate division WWE3 bacterium]|nr:cytochrome b5 domain-containing protein [candidate division WWE3 bacterium]
MENKGSIIGIFAIVAILAVGGFFLFKNNNSGTSTTDSQQNTPKTYALSEIAKHNTPSSCWMVINSDVYDVTSYIPSHANNMIEDGCGKDATAMYEDVRKHMGKGDALLPEYLIGTLQS